MPDTKTKKTKNKNTTNNNRSKKILKDKLAIPKEHIELTAYYIWEEKGRPDDCDLDNWIEAEKRFCC